MIEILMKIWFIAIALFIISVLVQQWKSQRRIEELGKITGNIGHRALVLELRILKLEEKTSKLETVLKVERNRRRLIHHTRIDRQISRKKWKGFL